MADLELLTLNLEQMKLEAQNIDEPQKQPLLIADVMLLFLNFIREQKPTMVNHGEKINLFEIEMLCEKFKNGA